MAANTVIGLDIGSMSIRATEARHSKSGPVITNFGQVAVPPDAVKDGVVQDDRAVTAALRQLWTSAKLGSKRVVLGVTNRQVVVRETAVANLSAREMRRSLPFQVREMLPLPLENSVLDFYPLGPAADTKTVRGLLVAAPKDAVLAAVHATERAGLHVEQVDLASFALVRAAARLDGAVEAIVDIGASATTLVVHANGVPLIVRTVPRGGHEITEMLAERLGVDIGGAEALKLRVGLHRDDEPETAEVIREVVRPLIREIRGSFTYVSAKDDQPRQVTRLVLSGGGSQLPGLAETLRQELDVEVVVADLMSRVRRTHRSVDEWKRQLPACATVSIGLSLGEVR